MELSEYLPFWNKLTGEQKNRLEAAAVSRSVAAGTVVHNGSADCLGLIVLERGQLRAYVLSDEGREITLYRLFERDMCLFSSSCMMQSIQFEITIAAEKDSRMWIIPPELYKGLMEESAAVANYTNQLLASRFSEVMWLLEQIMWKSFDQRLAAFLLEESDLEGTDVLHMTHEKMANHLGTAREVVTRMLRYFQGEGMVRLSRGMVELTDRPALSKLCGQ